MQSGHLPRLCAFLLVLLVLAPSASAAKYRLYYLGGQSNMDGFGKVNELPAELSQPIDGVMIFHGNSSNDGVPEDGRGMWTELQAGHGYGFGSDGKKVVRSDRFGVELSFAARMKELHPGERIAIIKYSRGGTSIDATAGAAAGPGCWEPDFKGGTGAGEGVNQYDHFLATLRHALSVHDIDGDGEEDTLVPCGIAWMQGESDADTPEIASRYQANLTRLMNLMRAALRVDDLPVAIGRISDSGQNPRGKVWAEGETIRSAQAAFCEADPAAKLVTSTDRYSYSDPYHYDSAGYVDLGKEFAQALVELEKK